MPNHPFHQNRLSCVLAVLLFCRAAQVLADDPLTLQTECHKGDITRVAINLEVDGQLTLTADGKPETLPMRVAAKFAYDEMRLDDCTSRVNRRSARFYTAVQAEFRIAKQSIIPQLREDRRLLLAEESGTGIVISSASGPLTREELDLVDIPGNTLMADCLLPEGEVKVGSSWKPSDKPLAKLLGIDVISRNDLQCVLKEVTDSAAKFNLTGSIAGAATGVATEMDLEGEATFDTDEDRLVSIQLRIKERRSAGHVSPAVDVTARLTIELASVDESEHLPDELIKHLPETAKTAAPLSLRPQSGSYEVLYDRRWHITRDEPSVTVLRLIDRGELIAQCNISPLTNAPADKPTTTEDFQADIQKALDKHFGSFDSVSSSTTSSGLKVLKAVVSGKVSDLPIEWRYYLIADDQGRRIAATFTMETGLVERFAELDAQIIESLSFTAPKLPSTK